MSGSAPRQKGRTAEAPRGMAKSGGQSNAVLSARVVRDLRVVASGFTDRDALEKTRLLAACRTLSIEDARVLLAYHDCLLFLLAYPQTRAWRDRLGGLARGRTSFVPVVVPPPGDDPGAWPVAGRRPAQGDRGHAGEGDGERAQLLRSPAQAPAAL